MPDEPLALGVDVGGTKIALALVGRDGRVRSERRLANREHADASALLEAVAVEARALSGEGSPAVEGVGVGVCELVDRSGEIVSSTTIPWTRGDVERALSSIGPVTVEADVRAAALAEAALGAGRGLETFGYVTVGTGVSSAFVREGVPWAGARGAAQLLGSARIDVPCPSCGRVVDVCLEDVGSGSGIAARYRKLSGADADDGKAIFEAADDGDEVAARVLSDAATALGSYVALFVNLFDPHAVVIGGGLASSSSFLASVVSSARDHVWAPHVRSLPIHAGALGASAGSIGAAWSVWRREGAA
jgi:glucokinase